MSQSFEHLVYKISYKHLVEIIKYTKNCVSIFI
jgi:hypothetical protein